MRQFLYLIGQPGAGKSTLMATAMEGVAWEQMKQPLAHIRYPGGIELGTRRQHFSGTDALPFHIQPQAIAWVGRSDAPEVILGEGDRLAGDGFFAAVKRAGYVMTVIYLNTPNDVAAARRRERGGYQSPNQIIGRRERMRKLAQTWVDLAWNLDGTRPLADLTSILQAHPAIIAARGDRLANAE